jgi:hypothetical protein
MGVVAMMALGILLVWVAFSQPPALIWQIFLIVLGVGSLLLADGLRRSTARKIELTRAGLRDSTGAIIARLDNIQSMDRGAFAFKPSNGFLVRLKVKEGERAWYPGMWWRLGRQIGIGGVTPGHQTKNMTAILEVLLVERDAGQEPH